MRVVKEDEYFVDRLIAEEKGYNIPNCTKRFSGFDVNW
jgi:hypothetical protein